MPVYEDCAPLAKYGDAFNGPEAELREKYLYPCGLIANSFFNDVFARPCVSAASSSSSSSSSSDGEVCEAVEEARWKSKGIAWESDSTRYRYRGIDNTLETRVSPHGIVVLFCCVV
jgi:hypothetical protein